MKNECNIVRDLLPLCIDGAASEDSRKLVEEHTAICEDCGKTRREMMLALPTDKEPEAEQAMLNKAAKKLRRERKRRIVAMIVIGLLLGVALIFGGKALDHYLRYDYCVPVALKDYDVRLSYLESGRIVCSILQSGMDVSWSTLGAPTEEGGWNLHFSVERPRIPKYVNVSSHVFQGTYNGLKWVDGKIYIGETLVTSITRGGAHGETEVLYEDGVDESRLMPASEQMEEYYRLYEVAALCHALRQSDAWMWDVVDESALPFARAEIELDRSDMIQEDIYRQMEELAVLVPEWQ